MTRRWIDLVRNSHLLTSLYSEVPPLEAVRLRSVHLDWRGPSLTLRLDLPVFPDNMSDDSLESSHDTLQIHIKFLAIDRVVLSSLPHSLVDISISHLGESRISVAAAKGAGKFSFTAGDELLIGHISSFARAGDGSDGGPRKFLSRLDARIFTSLPDVCERTFYERI
ncbi:MULTISPECIES: Imm50 family immunity protein [unclassified Streptomyces]|uniref:Imm50 family immunity protein n=1 Tax=unclassified Streptomyces TaxID=2593676 RepID=UPI00380CA1B9